MEIICSAPLNILNILSSVFKFTAELQWLEHLWNPENMFETGAVQANEC